MVKRSRKNYGYLRALQTAASAGRAARSMYNTYKTKRLRVAVPMTSGRGVTDQNDRINIYRKKSMPRRKKLRWKRFKQKVHAVAEKELGSRTVVFNRLLNTTPDFALYGSIAQIAQSIALYPLAGGGAHMLDLKNIAGYENTVNDETTHGQHVDPTTKFIFQSGILDITIRNTSYIVGFNGAEEGPATDCTLEVDIYEIVSGKEWTSSLTGEPANIVSALDVADSSTGEIGQQIQTNDISIGKRGATPWDLPHGLSTWRLKILKKTKMFVSWGKAITYQYRDPKRHVFTRQNMTERRGCNYPGVTKHVLVIAKAVLGIIEGATEGDTMPRLSTGVTRKYLYNIEGMNDTRDKMVFQ